MKITLIFVSLLLVVSAPGSAQKGTPAWRQADSAIRADYAKREARTKILEITQGERALLPFWVAYEADVSVERGGGRRDKERVGVSFMLVKGSWELDGVELLGRRELADVKPPTQEDAQKLLSAAWPADKCEGYDITQVKLDGVPRFQREPGATDPARAKRSYVYAVEVQATGNGKFRMSERGTQYSNRTQNLLTWDPDGKTWSVDPRQVRCAGWVRQEAQQSGAAAAPQAAGSAPNDTAQPATMASSDAPPDADAIKVFTQAWARLRPDFSVTAITVKAKEPHQSQERRWITYKLAILATGTDQGAKSMAGKSYLCEPADYSSVLKWDADAKMWKVDESMIKNFNESSCTPKR
jgi:hypothetical protein